MDICNETAGNTIFSCENCFHTATLDEINETRVTAARGASRRMGMEIRAATITLNEGVVCPVCNSIMKAAGTIKQREIQEIKRKFIKQVKKDPLTRGYDPEAIWQVVENSIGGKTERVPYRKAEE